MEGCYEQTDLFIKPLYLGEMTSTKNPCTFTFGWRQDALPYLAFLAFW